MLEKEYFLAVHGYGIISVLNGLKEETRAGCELD